MKLAFYIARTVIIAILLVTLIFIALTTFINLVGEAQQVGQGYYNLPQAISYTLLKLPLFIYQIFPTVALIGVLLGLGSLATHSELMVMRASGMSLKRITGIVLSASFIVIVIMTFIGEVIAPSLARYADVQKMLEQNKGQAISTISGVWLRDDNTFFHILAIKSAGEIYGVTRFQFDQKHHLVTASQASSGKLVGNRWLFSNVVTSVMGKNRVTQIKQAQTSWPLRFNLHQFTELDPNLLTLNELYQQVEYGHISGINTNRDQMAYWTRVLQPLSTLIMVLIAIPFVFGSLRSVSIGLRLLSGIAVGLIFHILDQFLSSFSMAYQIPPLLAASALPLIFLAFAIFLFWWKE